MSLPVPTNISCVQFNCHHAREAMFDLEARLLNRSFTIALIQEPYILRRNPCLLPSGWKRFYLKDSSCRALILCSPDLQVIAHGALTK